ncbi:hypothetical protein M5689_021073 [Euphorbia peplus]|nr:hypothetical protein M5689_021073 [Euphorbia peplus]
MLKKVTDGQIDGTPQQVEHTSKQVEFEGSVNIDPAVEKSGTPIVEVIDEGEVSAQKSPQQHLLIAIGKSHRNRQKPVRFRDTVACASSVEEIPMSYSEAV